MNVATYLGLGLTQQIAKLTTELNEKAFDLEVFL